MTLEREKLTPFVFLFLISACLPSTEIKKNSRIENSSLEERVSHLFRLLSILKINHFHTKEHLDQFFLNPQEDTELFVVQMTLKMKEQNIYRMKVDYYRILDIKIEGDKGYVYIEYGGRKRFPLIKGKIKEVQQWVLKENTWYLTPSRFMD